MDEGELKKAFGTTGLGGLRYFDSIGSTNDEALAWASQGAGDLSLVVADEQTRGRGRGDRKWFTPKGTALAFSLILLPEAGMRPHLSRTVGLAALSVVDLLQALELEARIKWPNDLLLNNRKLAGILVETVWSGDEMDSLVVGIGINVLKEAVPPLDLLQFPATSLEESLGQAPPRRIELLRGILQAFIKRRPDLGTDELIKAWQDALAFRGEQVQVNAGGASAITGELLGLEPDGSLRLRADDGHSVIVRFGDVSLRPAA
jgi:BirA family biotin operon repressor/biotin-[acetyl-CoA-carboxylase] ligase